MTRSLAESAATASSSSREQETAKRGAKAARSRPPAAPSQRLRSARLSSIDCCVSSRSRAGTLSSESIMHLPTVARSPISASGFEHDVGVVHGLHRQGRRRAREQQFGRRQARGRAQRGGRVRRFHRPDPAPQPLEQRHVVGIAAEERLAQVDVRLDEAGKEVGAAGVDDVVARRLRFRADRHDASAVDGDRALDDVEAVVHREDGRVADEGGHGVMADVRP